MKILHICQRDDAKLRSMADLARHKGLHKIEFIHFKNLHLAYAADAQEVQDAQRLATAADAPPDDPPGMPMPPPPVPMLTAQPPRSSIAKVERKPARNAGRISFVRLITPIALPP